MEKINLNKIQCGINFKISTLRIDLYALIGYNVPNNLNGILDHLDIDFDKGVVKSTHPLLKVGVTTHAHGGVTPSTPLGRIVPQRDMESRGILISYKNGDILMVPRKSIILKRHHLGQYVLSDADGEYFSPDGEMEILKVSGNPDTFVVKGYKRTRDVYVY